MREIIYYSKSASTTGNFKDLMRAGRMDIVCHIIIMAFFLSNKIRTNVKLHLFFNGQPDPPKHLELMPKQNIKFQISKKNIAGMIKRILYKYKKDKKIEAFPGCFIDKISLIDFVNQSDRNFYVLDKKGGDIRKVRFKENPIFIMGDQDGIPKKDLKKIKGDRISLGSEVYFASQSLTILNNELDRREL
tara:strand:+ start:807 stop:1373 length:567 start_codon:yes stop_codon:yes gene_type:complete